MSQLKRKSRESGSPSSSKRRKAEDHDEEEEEEQAPKLGEDFFDVYGSEACADVEVKPLKRPLRIQDVQDLILWVLGEGVSPQWVFLKNKPLIKQVVLVMVGGLEGSMVQREPCLQQVVRCLGEACEMQPMNVAVTAPTTAEALLTVYTPASSGRPAGARVIPEGPSTSPEDAPTPHASAPPSHDDTDFASVKGPFPTEYYQVTPAQMADHGYPVPVPDKAGELVCPEGYVATQPQEEGGGGFHSVLAIDCEMCMTSQGHELTRATVLDSRGAVLLDQLVLPPNPITDYLTPYSGITAAMLEGVTARVADVQRALLRLASADTLLIGHSLENDLHKLKVVHAKVLDTALAFSHPRGPPFKPSLKVLAERHLKRSIQASAAGHDSAEDARAALHLARLKVEKGPMYGEGMYGTRRRGESLLDILDRHRRRCTLLDRRNHLCRMLSGSAGATPCESDDEVVAAACKALGNAKNDFVWAQLCDLATRHEAHARAARQEAAAQAGAAQPDACTPAAKPIKPMEDVLNKLASQVRRLYESARPNTLVVVASGHGNSAAVRWQQEQKMKRLQGVDGRPKWDDVSEERLASAMSSARDAVCFVAVKQRTNESSIGE